MLKKVQQQTVARDISLRDYIAGLDPADIMYRALPQRRTLEDYEAAIHRVLEYFKRYKEIAAVYHFGGFDTPGISDIDMVVVFHDDVRSFKHSPGGALDRYLFMHGVYGMPRRVFARRSLLVPMYGLTLLSGEEVPLADTAVGADEEEGRSLLVLYALEYLLENVAALGRQLLSGAIGVRGVLCSLYALRHDFSILRAGEVSAKEQAFVEAVGSMRREWMAGAAEEWQRMVALAAEAIECALEVISSFSTSAEHDSNASPPEPISFGAGFHAISGLDNQAEVLIFTKAAGRLCLRAGRRIRGKTGRQFRDIGLAFSPGCVVLPRRIMDVLNGSTGGVMGRVHERRAQLLREYVAFMRNVSPMFAVFDVFRRHNRGNLKWLVLDAVNRLVFHAKQT